MDKQTAINEGYTPVNIIVGRFQPLTTGHIKCAEEVYKKTGMKSVLCMIYNHTSKINQVKPFSSEMLSYMYANIIATNAYPFIEGFITVQSADIIKNNQILKKNGYIAASWSCGSDRAEAYNKMVKKYAKDADLLNNFKVYEIKRTQESISATHIRYYIATNDFENFLKYTPFKVLNRQEARKCFDKLMTYSMKVLNDLKF